MQKKTTINVNFKKVNHQLEINHSLLIRDLKQMIFTHFQISPISYSLFYKNTKLSLDDNRPLYSVIGKEKYPSFYIISKSSITSSSLKETNATIYSNLPESKFANILSKFFQSKSIPFNAQIDSSTKGLYIIKFQTPILSQEFSKYYEQHKRNKKYPLNLGMGNSQSLTGRRIDKSTRKSNKLILPKIKRCGSTPYLNTEEKYRHEAYLDKKNWIKPQGFYVSVGKYSMKSNFISNYVAMTPSEPPSNYKYRDVNKKKWITSKGFC